MSVESAQDMASFFAANEFAEAAFYQSPTPGAAAVPCLVIVDTGQGRERFALRQAQGERDYVGSERHLWAMAGGAAAQLADVKRDGIFTLSGNGEVLRVAGLPKLDHTGHLWSVDLVMTG